MNLLDQARQQIDSYQISSRHDHLKWRPILVYAVLEGKTRETIIGAMARIEPGYNPSESALRKMVELTRAQMGFPPLPTSDSNGKNKGGRVSAKAYSAYLATHSARWIDENGGMPRPEQFADPLWDLRPYPPTIPHASTAPPAPSTALPFGLPSAPVPDLAQAKPPRPGARVAATGTTPARPTRPVAPVLASSGLPATCEGPQCDRSVEEIQEEMRNVPVTNEEAWKKEVFRLQCELFTVTHQRAPDPGDMIDLRGGVSGMWRDARKHNKQCI